jgi:hypothetical protein
MATSRALRARLDGADAFPADVAELIAYFEPHRGRAGARHPGAGTRVRSGSSDRASTARSSPPISDFLRLRLALRAAALEDALRLYRARFRPSRDWPRPRFMLALNVFAARPTPRGLPDEFDASGLRQPAHGPTRTFAAASGERGGRDRSLFRAGVDQALACSAVGSPVSVRAALRGFVERHRPDEVILTSQIHDHRARLRSFEIAAEAMETLEEVRA